MNTALQTIESLAQRESRNAPRGRGRLGIIIRIGRAISTLAQTAGNLLFSAIVAWVAAALTGGIGLVLGIPLGLYFLTRCLVQLIFSAICHIEESTQTVHGQGRCQSDTVRESTSGGELAYTKHTTNFRTVQSGSFVFRTAGYRELKPGDQVRVRLFRWTRRGRIKDYDILSFDLNF